MSPNKQLEHVKSLIENKIEFCPIEEEIGLKVFHNVSQYLHSCGNINGLYEIEMCVFYDSNRNKMDEDRLIRAGTINYHKVNSWINLHNNDKGNTLRLFLAKNLNEIGFTAYTNNFTKEMRLSSKEMFQEIIGVIPIQNLDSSILIGSIVTFLFEGELGDTVDGYSKLH